MHVVWGNLGVLGKDYAVGYAVKFCTVFVIKSDGSCAENQVPKKSDGVRNRQSKMRTKKLLSRSLLDLILCDKTYRTFWLRWVFPGQRHKQHAYLTNMLDELNRAAIIRGAKETDQ